MRCAPAATPNDEVAIYRAGRLVERKRVAQVDIRYDTLVNTIPLRDPRWR